jgi:hypothetical protein
MLHVVLDRQDICKTILEKAFFFIFFVFLSFFGFFVKKFQNRPFKEVNIFFLEIGHIGYKKIENCMLISKKQTCQSGKMLSKRVKIKKTVF